MEIVLCQERKNCSLRKETPWKPKPKSNSIAKLEKKLFGCMKEFFAHAVARPTSKSPTRQMIPEMLSLKKNLIRKKIGPTWLREQSTKNDIELTNKLSVCKTSSQLARSTNHLASEIVPRLQLGLRKRIFCKLVDDKWTSSFPIYLSAFRPEPCRVKHVCMHYCAERFPVAEGLRRKHIFTQRFQFYNIKVELQKVQKFLLKAHKNLCRQQPLARRHHGCIHLFAHSNSASSVRL